MVQGKDNAVTLGDLQVDNLLGIIEDGFGQAVQDIWDFGTDLPSFVAREGPESPPAAFVKPIVRAACRSYARGAGPQNLPGFAAVWGGICEPYLESIDELPGDGYLGLPFEGGQCADVYLVSFSAGGSLSGTQSGEIRMLGPIGGSRLIENPDGGRSFQIFASGYAAGFVGCGGVPQAAPQWFTIVGFGPNQTDYFGRINGVTPCGSNNCGDPPPVYAPPRTRPGLPPVPTTPIRIPGIGPVDVDVEFNPDGTINIGLPDVGVEVNVDPFGEGEGGPGGGGGGGPSDGPPGDVGEPGGAVAVGPGGEAEGEAPPGSVLVGVRVQITSVPESRSRYTEDVLRGAYYLYMGVPGLLDLDPGGAMVRLDQFFFAEKDNLTSWRISANSRYELITTPYYREIGA